MEKDVIKYEGLRVQEAQQLIDKLATKVGQPKYTWKNLEDTVSLAEQLKDIADALKGLDGKCDSKDCPSHYTGNNNSNVSHYNGCSSNNSMVDAKVCSGNYDFSCNKYDIEFTAR